MVFTTRATTTPHYCLFMRRTMFERSFSQTYQGRSEAHDCLETSTHKVLWRQHSGKAKYPSSGQRIAKRQQLPADANQLPRREDYSKAELSTSGQRIAKGQHMPADANQLPRPKNRARQKFPSSPQRIAKGQQMPDSLGLGCAAAWNCMFGAVRSVPVSHVKLIQGKIPRVGIITVSWVML